MNSSENIVAVLQNQLQADIEYEEVHGPNFGLSVFTDRPYPLELYNILIKWFINPAQTPEDIIHLLDSCLSQLDGFDTCKIFQAQVAFICLEAIAMRRPQVLSGPWERVANIIVEYFHAGWGYGAILEFIDESTIEWIMEVCSPRMCPSPSLRRELYKLLQLLGSLASADRLREGHR